MSKKDFSDWLSDEESNFRQDYERTNVPDALEDLTVAALKKRRLLPEKRQVGLSVFIIAVGVLFLLGFILGRNSNQHANLSPQLGYVLLLSNPVDFQNNGAHRQEYSDWYRKNQNAMIDGEELQNNGWLLKGVGANLNITATHSDQGISGYFIVHAFSNEAAIKLAAECPHLKYNGEIMVRPIQTEP